MFDEAMRAHLHSGCALLVGSVSPDGRPHASRGHGITVLDDAPPRVRLLLASNDLRSQENLRATGAIAITTADVSSLHSLQLKGRVDLVEPATPRDIAKAQQYMDDFVGDIMRNDGYARDDIEAWLPSAFVACEVMVREIFDQTPGPSAGGALRERSA